MSTSTKSSNRRKGAAVALAVLGIAGLSLASAAQLNLTGTSQFQAGVTDLASCQTTTVNVKFATPTLTSGAYKSASVDLVAIDAACATKTYKLSFLDAAGAPVVAEKTGTLAAGTLTVSLTGVNADSIKTVALTIFS